MKQTLYISFAAIMVLHFFCTLSCNKGGSNPVPNGSPTGSTTPNNNPTITSLSVNTGVYNANVIINGTNFSAVMSNNQVLFNGKAATITAATITQLTVAVPLGAGTGPVSVTVNGNKATGPVFTYQVSEVVSTFIGGTSNGTLNGPGASISLLSPGGVTVDATGNLYISMPLTGIQLILKATPGGVVSSYAGIDIINSSYNGTVAPVTLYPCPQFIAIDPSGNIYGTTTGTRSIIKITSQGVLLSAFAGSGSYGSANGTGAAATFSSIYGIAADASGNIYVSDSDNNLIRKVSSVGVVTTFAGSGKTGSADGPAASASFNGPDGITVDANGNVYVCDFLNNSVRKITQGGVVSTVATSLYQPRGVAVDASGNVYIADTGNRLIKMVTPAGVVNVIAGRGYQSVINGPALLASFDNPIAIVADNNNNLYVVDTNSIRKISMQ
jgi:sugar lactone lactonase YvrE